MADEIRVEGLAELRRAFRDLDKEAKKGLRLANKSASEIVAEAARAKVPVRTGRARASVRATATQSSASVKEGGAQAPYVPWLDYGGAVGRNKATVRPFVKGGRIIYPAVRENEQRVVESYDDAIHAAIRAAGLV